MGSEGLRNSFSFFYHGLTAIQYKKKLQKEVGMAMHAKMYSNEGGKDDSKYNRHPYITHIHAHLIHVSQCPCGAVKCVCDIGMPVVFVIIPTTLV